MAYNDYKKRIVQSRWHLIFFLSIELFCLLLVVSSNQNQQAIFDNSVGIFKNRINQRLSGWSSYINLESVVDSLVEQNASLIQEINNGVFYSKGLDSTGISNYYEVISAKVISRTTGKRKNYIVIDKGKTNGIRTGSGVIAGNGIIGVVTEITDNFSRIMTLHHPDLKLSVKVGAKHQYGIMQWNTWSDNDFIIKDFPKYWDVEKGDTVFTSGYSTLFPANIPVGRIKEMSLAKGTNNKVLESNLLMDINGEDRVYVLKNNYRSQLDTLLSHYEE